MEDLKYVEAFEGGTLHVAMFPVDRRYGFRNFVADGSSMREIRLVTHHDDWWRRFLARSPDVEDVVSEASDFLKRFRVVDGKYQEKSLRCGHGQTPHGRELEGTAGVQELQSKVLAATGCGAIVSSMQFFYSRAVLSWNAVVQELVDER